MSLEDIVIAKAGSYRDTDMNDIRSQEVINNLDFALLDRLAEEKASNALNRYAKLRLPRNVQAIQERSEQKKGKEAERK